MADKIKVNTDLLERCAGDLKALAQGFGDAASILSGLNTSEEWWADMGRLSSLKLQDEGGSASLGRADAAVRALGAVMGRYDARLTRLGGSVSKAAELFNTLESTLSDQMSNMGTGSSGVITGNGGASGQSSGEVAEGADQDGTDWLKYIRKLIGKAGLAGKTVSTVWSLIDDYIKGKLGLWGIGKYLVEGTSIVTKWADLFSRYEKLSHFGKDYSNPLMWKEMFGLNKFWSRKNPASTLSKAANGLDRFNANFSKQFEKGMGNTVSWITSGFSSAINNYDQHKEGLKTGAVTWDRVGVEWVTETAGTVVIGAASTAAAAAGLAAIGVTGAPVIVVGAAACAVTWAADWTFKAATGSEKGIAESIGDGAGYLYDNAIKPAVSKGIQEGAKTLKALKDRVTSAISVGWSQAFA